MLLGLEKALLLASEEGSHRDRICKSENLIDTLEGSGDIYIQNVCIYSKSWGAPGVTIDASWNALLIRNICIHIHWRRSRRSLSEWNLGAWHMSHLPLDLSIFIDIYDSYKVNKMLSFLISPNSWWRKCALMETIL